MITKNKLLIIVGPTAVGKTELAVQLAKKFNGELLSADSRQVYKHLDIGTGKDLPVTSKFEFQNSKIGGFYHMHKTPLWGYDLVDPKEQFSVSDYVKYAKAIIENIWKRGKLPIIVGGAGFYVQALVDGVETIDVPQNKPLRRQLETMSVEELFEILARLDATKAASLNSSDRRNKVRLIRAIEIADARIRGIKQQADVQPVSADILMIGLKTDSDVLKEKIKQRVEKRLEMGIEKEIEKLLELGVMWQDQSMSSLGYRQWKDYFERARDRQEVVDEWVHEEQKYAKRQMTWFKRDGRIQWIDHSDAKIPEKVERMVQKWYSMN